MRRAQIEMIGLVFIVVLLVIGAVLYVRFSTADTSGTRAAQDMQGATSFLVAVKETTIPSCGASIERVAAACIERRSLCPGSDPCSRLQDSLDALAHIALGERGVHYNLSIEGTGIEAVDGCRSGDARVDLVAAPRSPIVLSGGRSQRFLVLSVCK
jgi:hypothetical protein